MSVGSPDLLIEAEAAAEAAVETEGADVAARSPTELFWRRFLQDRVAVAAGVFIVLLILAAVFAPLIVKIVGAPGPYTPDDSAVNEFGLPTGPSPHGPLPFVVLAIGAGLALVLRVVPNDKVKRYGWAVSLGVATVLALVLALIYWPHAKHIFGVDLNHFDVFTRVLYGARTSLEVAIIATGISLVIGVVLGMISGYYRGAVDTVISRVVDVLLAFPVLLLALGIGAACSIGVGGQPSKGCLGGLLQPGLPVVIAVIAFVNWTYIARIIRGQVLSLREKEFIEAARALGASNRRIIFKDILPNLWAPIIVYATLIIPTNVLFEAALSYLGVGVRYPTASWGKMLSDASGGNLGINTVWWLMLFPGAALLLTVLAFNLLGDGLQDALNPRSSRT